MCCVGVNASLFLVFQINPQPLNKNKRPFVMIPFLKIQKEEIRKILLIISIKLNLYCSQSSEARQENEYLS